MFKYTLFITICVAVSYQSFANAKLQSGKDEAKKAFHELMAIIDNALIQANSTLNNAMELVKSKVTELEDKANEELDNILDPLRKKLSDLIAEAKAKGFDVTQCQTYVDKFSQTPDDLTRNLIDCFNQQINRAQKDVNDALTNCREVEQNLNNIDADINKCGDESIWKQIVCYAEIIETIAKDIVVAPEEISKDVADAEKLVTNIIPNLELCFTNQLKKAGNDAAQNVADFAVCAAVSI